MGTQAEWVELGREALRALVDTGVTWWGLSLLVFGLVLVINFKTISDCILAHRKQSLAREKALAKIRNQMEPINATRRVKDKKASLATPANVKPRPKSGRKIGPERPQD